MKLFVVCTLNLQQRNVQAINHKRMRGGETRDILQTWLSLFSFLFGDEVRPFSLAEILVAV